MGFESIGEPGQSSEVERNPKMSIFFLTGEGWQMGFESIDQPGRSPEVERNPKMSILFFWLETGGRRGLSPIDQPSQSSEVEYNPKMSILFFDNLGGLFCIFTFRSTFFLRSLGRSSEVEHNPKTFYFSMTYWAFFIFLCFGQHFLLRSLGWSSEVELNPKMNILFFDDLGGLLHFFAFRSTFFARITQLIIRSWT